MPVECLVNPSDASYRTYLATRLAFGQFAHPSTGYPDSRPAWGVVSGIRGGSN